jgi:hypothetical protein
MASGLIPQHSRSRRPSTPTRPREPPVPTLALGYPSSLLIPGGTRNRGRFQRPTTTAAAATNPMQATRTTSTDL